MLRNLRRLSQILFLLFFIVLFLLARYPYEGNMPLDLGLRFSPLIPLFDFIAQLRITWIFWPGLVVLVLTPFLGRIFCGWICPLGTSIDIASKIIKSPNNRGKNLHKWRQLKFSLLVGTLLLAVFSIHLWGYLDPLSIFNRALTVVFYPLFTLGSEQSLLALSTLAWLEDPAYAVYDTYKLFLMPEPQAFYQQIFWIALFIGAIFAAEKISRRFWCRYMCPAGALLGFLSQFRFLERVVGESCPACNRCQTDCKMNAIPAGDLTKTSKVECIQCFSCAQVCPPKNKSIAYRWRWKPYRTKTDFERRSFLRTTGASALTLGLLSLGLNNRDKKMRHIRPPGSVPEDAFYDRCIRCMECVRVCASNGRCLQPASIDNNLQDLWVPIAVMREGYCEYNCNMCGQVCPTDAILPLALAEKQKTKMGLAHFNKDICIPYARNEDCIVCEEHCPLPEKAIRFELREVTASDGQKKQVKYPYVDRRLCIGCGICETKCPLLGEAGIFVTIDQQQRPGALTKV